MAALPRLTINGSLSPVSETGSPIDPTARKLTLLRKIRAPPFKYAWNFYHDKASGNSSTTYENRLTLLQSDIITVKPFWEVLNSFPFDALKLKDSVHFFKRGVKPVWEDRRNVKGGAWTFRIAKGQAEEFFKQVLFMGVGEQFADVIQPGDDICGISMSVRFNSNLISVWNRLGDNESSRENILRVVQDVISADLKKLMVAGSFYYKRHSEHAGFSEMVAKARQAEQQNDEGKITEAEVNKEEGDKALLKEAEGIDIRNLK